VEPRIRSILGVIIFASIMLTACATAIQAAPEQVPTEVQEGESSQPEPEKTVKVESDSSDLDPTEEPEEEVAVPTEDSPQDTPPRGAASQFTTDFSKHTVSYSEILSGGPPKDGIPAVDNPKYVSVGEAGEWLDAVEPVVIIQVGGQARAYPLQILMWHEIVNDTLADVPLVVTFCPLCNTAIAFERERDGVIYDFGTTGRLRFSNLIMYDRQTETWWQQATGEAIAGELTGDQLVFYPAAIIAWEDFKSTYPDGSVLSRDTGHNPPYGSNPYAGYDNVNQSPFLYVGPDTPGVLPAMARVITVELDEEAVAYPYETLQEVGVVNDTVAGQEIVIFWMEGTASALDASTLSAGKDVGAANSFSRQVDGETLTFRFEDGRILDDQTDSEWDVLGRAVSGTMEGTQLEPVVSINHFWFSWAAFRPKTRIYQP